MNGQDQVQTRYWSIAEEIDGNSWHFVKPNAEAESCIGLVIEDLWLMHYKYQLIRFSFQHSFWYTLTLKLLKHSLEIQQGQARPIQFRTQFTAYLDHILKTELWKLQGSLYVVVSIYLLFNTFGQKVLVLTSVKAETKFRKFSRAVIKISPRNSLGNYT